jgi:hypothetical protein
MRFRIALPVHFWKRTTTIVERVFWVLTLCYLAGYSPTGASAAAEKARTFVRSVEFDYVGWMANAAYLKIVQAAAGTPDYLPAEKKHQLVLDYLDQVARVAQLENKITEVYADPANADPAQAVEEWNRQLALEKGRLGQIAPLAEAILQQQVVQLAAENGLTLIGQAVPPLAYHTTELPLDLVLSPRNAIRQETSLSLNPGMSADEKDRLEKQIQARLDYSALVVPVGGIGVYPTMVMMTTDLNWLAEVIAHEWTHNLLTLRPLGLNYGTSADLRTINETTASMVGRELGAEVIRRYYPERAPAPPSPQKTPDAPQTKPKFSFQAEMHATRVQTDALLAQGKIAEAEAYMESRRVMFWEHGYQIRKLNQAYFAFYGAYNDTSEGGNANGSAGEDPIGPALAAVRKKSASLADFVNRVAWVTSLEQLQKLAR